MWVFYLFLLCLVSLSLADIPVNCSHGSIAGVWTFYVGRGGHDNTINCEKDFAIVEEVSIHLQSPDVARIAGSSGVGFWTMVFNQGFEVVVVGRKLFAFSNYTKISTMEGVSHCSSTLNGWVHDVSGKNWACYYGVKNPSGSAAPTRAHGMDYAQEHGQGTAGLDLGTADVELDRKYIRSMDYISRINSVAETWTAAHYPELEGVTLRDLMSRAGGLVLQAGVDTDGASERWNDRTSDTDEPPEGYHSRNERPRDTGGAPDVMNQRERDFVVNLFRRKFNSRVEEDTLALGSPSRSMDAAYEELDAEWPASPDHLPASIDWRDIGGVSYVPPVREQGLCGSCYAIATASMLSSRLMVHSKGAVRKVFSPQEVVSCSEYAQGCAGGFAYLIGKYAEDFGVVEEGCFPYTASDDPCSDKLEGCRRFYARDYRYVGGFYGACNEHDMMVELVRNGPFAIGYEVYSDFNHYRSGVYKHTAIEDEFNAWMPINHAVLLVGYGVEAGVKYWVAQNSWGSDWGEDGYFRIARGRNEANFESSAVAATPVMPVV